VDFSMLNAANVENHKQLGGSVKPIDATLEKR
jgi:hypothetical protein